MPSSARIQALVETLHYLTPFAVFLYYLVAATIGVCTLQKSNTDGRRNPRTAVLWAMLAVFITYVYPPRPIASWVHRLISHVQIIEDGMILSQLSSANSPFATTDTNIYALASILVWFVLTSTLLGSDKPVWYPLNGSWTIAAVSELLTFGLRLSHYWPSSSVEQAQISVQAVRILLLLSLPVLTFIWPRIRAAATHNDEEAAPLLAHSQETSGESQASAGTSKYGSTDTNSTTVTVITSTGQTEEVVDEDTKKEREDRARLEKRLKETGNWWSYVRGFAVGSYSFS